MIDITKLTPDQVEKFIHLQAIIDRQKERQDQIRACRDYYGGDHPVALSERQMEYIGAALTAGDFAFSHNVVKIVVDMLAERLDIVGFNVNGMSADNSAATLAATIWGWWKANRLPSRQTDLYVGAMRDWASYVIVDYDYERDIPKIIIHTADDGTSGIVLHRDPSDQDRVLYATRYFNEFDPLTPGKTGTSRKTVYLPGEVRKYKLGTAYTPMGGVSEWTPCQDTGDPSWPLPWVDRMGKPLGVNVFEFANPGGSEIAQIAGLQNALNKSWLDLLAAADASGFPVIAIEYDEALPGAPENEDDTDLSGSDELNIAPGHAFVVEGGRAHRLEGANMDQMLEVIWSIVNALAITARIPQHDLRPLKGIQFPSGESLKQLEAGTTKKVEAKQMLFGQSWADVFAMAVKVQNAFGTPVPDVPGLQIDPVWYSAGTRSEMTDAQVAQIHQTLGVPDEALWEYVGYTAEQIARFKAIRDAVVNNG